MKKELLIIKDQLTILVNVWYVGEDSIDVEYSLFLKDMAMKNEVLKHFFIKLT